MRAVSGAVSVGPKLTRHDWRLRRCGSPKPRQRRPTPCKAHGWMEPCKRLGGATMGPACLIHCGAARTAAGQARTIFHAPLLPSRRLAGRWQPSRRLAGRRRVCGPLGNLGNCCRNLRRHRLSRLLGRAPLHRRFTLRLCPSSKGLAARSLAPLAGCHLGS